MITYLSSPVSESHRPQPHRRWLTIVVDPRVRLFLMQGRQTVQRHAMKMLTRIEVTTVLQRLFCTVFDDVFREQTVRSGVRATNAGVAERMATASLPPSKLVANPDVTQMYRVLCHMQGQMGPTQPASYAFRSKRHQIRDFAWLLFLYAKGKKDGSSCGFRHWDETCLLLFVCFHFPSSR